MRYGAVPILLNFTDSNFGLVNNICKMSWKFSSCVIYGLLFPWLLRKFTSFFKLLDKQALYGPWSWGHQILSLYQRYLRQYVPEPSNWRTCMYLSLSKVFLTSFPRSPPMGPKELNKWIWKNFTLIQLSAPGKYFTTQKRAGFLIVLYVMLLQKNNPSKWDKKIVDAMTKDFSWEAECCDIHISAYTAIKN